uniref:Uncharacterized protein LOC110210513 n=1 Tax=Phascolarctos cinereus TaxID=38626 RepID=A0A6P5KHR7_PHACI|nr:uncharacterized protein LOC110210513 [Phascolarctos cinereus]
MRSETELSRGSEFSGERQEAARVQREEGVCGGAFRPQPRRRVGQARVGAGHHGTPCSRVRGRSLEVVWGNPPTPIFLMSGQKDLSRDPEGGRLTSRSSFHRTLEPGLEGGQGRLGPNREREEDPACKVEKILIVITLVLYILAQAPEPYIVITAFEAVSVVFFIVLYILRLDLLLRCLFWPLLDIINSLMTIMCLMIVSVLALVPETKIKVAIGGILGIVATVFTIADASLIYRKLMFNPSGPTRKSTVMTKSDVFVTLAALITPIKVIRLIPLWKKMKD